MCGERLVLCAGESCDTEGGVTMWVKAHDGVWVNMDGMDRILLASRVGGDCVLYAVKDFYHGDLKYILKVFSSYEEGVEYRNELLRKLTHEKTE